MRGEGWKWAILRCQKSRSKVVIEHQKVYETIAMPQIAPDVEDEKRRGCSWKGTIKNEAFRLAFGGWWSGTKPNPDTV